MKPSSNRRSASSNTRTDNSSKPTEWALWRWSIIRPGVATTMSGRDRSDASWTCSNQTNWISGLTVLKCVRIAPEFLQYHQILIRRLSRWKSHFSLFVQSLFIENAKFSYLKDHNNFETGWHACEKMLIIWHEKQVPETSPSLFRYQLQYLTRKASNDQTGSNVSELGQFLQHAVDSAVIQMNTQ